MESYTKWKPLQAFKERQAQFSGTLNRKDFRQLLQYERLRTDRTGSRFTIVIIRLDFNGIDPPTFRRFLATVFVHMRDTDHAGWISEGKIGILLPDTTISGAQVFIKNIHDKTNDFEIVKSVGVSMYPRVGNLEILFDEIDKETDYFATYDKKLKAFFTRPIPGWKRILDVAGSITSFILFLPIFLLIPLYILLISPGPIFYIQERVGQGGLTFRLLKFRTMKTSSDPDMSRKALLKFIKDGDSLKVSDENETGTLSGMKFIRVLGLDNLPQLWNILKGEMSLVGPNPCVPYEAELYFHWHKRRFDILPGLTGLWVIKGNECLTFKDRIRLDIRYAEKMSIWSDIGILFLTIPARLFWIAQFKMKRRRSAA